MGKILRRSLLIGTAAIAGGVAFGTWTVRRDYENPLEDRSSGDEHVFNPYLSVTGDNLVTVYVPRAEMGQGVTTTLPALVAEELDVPLESIRIALAPAAAAYYNAAMLEDGVPLPHFDRSTVANLTRDAAGIAGKVFGLQVTGGSSSVKDAWQRMRVAGATAREALRQAAAEREAVPFADTSTEDAHVVANGKRIPFGELAEAAAKVSVPDDIVLRSSDEWRILGKPQPRKDLLPKVTGAPIFGMDVDDDVILSTLRREGAAEGVKPMLYASVCMNPRLGGSMKKFDGVEAKKVRGVVAVADISGGTSKGGVNESEPYGDGFAVVATNTWAAFKGVDAVRAEWGEAPYPATSAEITDVIEKALVEGDGDDLRGDGDVELAFADAPRSDVLEADYSVPYLAHACMEPMNATVLVRDDRVDVWAPTQMPTLVRSDVAAETGMEPERVFVHSTFLGGGFGRRGELDFTRYAARIAARVPGQPVKCVWTREEDTRHDTYRPAAMGRFKARVAKGELPQAVDMRIACPSVMASAFSRTFPSISTVGPDNSITQGAFDQPYSVPNYRVSGVKAPVAIPIGFWRSVGNSYNGFFHEGFMDEIAHRSGLDPIAMRLELMREHPTALGVVRKVAEMSDWSAPRPSGTGKGFAFTLSFGCWTAQVCEVSVQDDLVTIENVWCAADLGLALDPEIVKAQLSSGIVFGLSSAMDQKITFADGMVEQANFYDFDAMRIHQCPNIEIELLGQAEHMGGAGEPGTPPAIPALVNAIYDATGNRVRSLPLTDAGFRFA